MLGVEGKLHLESSIPRKDFILTLYQKYDLILIAPQLRYKEAQLSQKLKPIKVQSIEPSVFATYHCQGLLEQIEKYCKSEVKS